MLSNFFFSLVYFSLFFLLTDIIHNGLGMSLNKVGVGYNRFLYFKLSYCTVMSWGFGYWRGLDVVFWLIVKLL